MSAASINQPTRRTAGTLLLSFCLLALPGLHTAWSQATGEHLYLNNEIKFDRLAEEQGSGNRVFDMLQDRKGFMWIATLEDGLYKYDGYTVTAYRHNPTDTNSLPDNSVQALYEDRSGLIWVGCGGGSGACSFDPQTGKWTRYAHNPANANSLCAGPIHAIAEDFSGNLWFASMLNGIMRYTPKTGIFTRFEKGRDPASLDNNRVVEVTVDRSGRVWVGTGAGLNLFDPKTGRFEHVRGGAQGLSLPQTGEVHCIFQDRGGLLWLTTLTEGVYVMDPHTKEIKAHYAHDPRNANSLSSNFTYAIAQDSTGNYWIGSGEGLNRLDPKTGTFTVYSHKDYLAPVFNGHSILTDHSGLVWFGTMDKGAVYFAPVPRRFREYPGEGERPLGPEGASPHSIFRSHDGGLYVVTNADVYRFDPATGAFTPVYSTHQEKKVKLPPELRAACEGAPGVFWLATDAHGLIRYDSRTNQSRFYQHDSTDGGSLAGKQVFALLRSRDGVLWVATVGGKLQWYNPATDRFARYHYGGEQDTTVSAYEGMTFIHEDRRGELWLSPASEFFNTGGHGVYRINTKTGRVIHYQYVAGRPNSLSSNSVSCLYEDPKGIIWMGTNGSGLNRLDPLTGAITVFTTADGLLSDNITAITGNPGGGLWIVSREGLTFFDPATRRHHWFDRTDGLPDSYKGTIWTLKKAAAIYQDPGGTIYFSNNKGITAFDPRRIKLNRYQPPVVLNGLRVFDKPVPIPPKGIVLHYNQNFFDLDFAALSYLLSAKNRYAYRLQGIDKDWVQNGTRHTARYTDLKPGRYTFRVKVSNNDGVWNEQGLSIPLVIRPPWWSTWWFRVPVALLAVGLFYGVIRWRERQKFRLQLERSEKEKQLADLRHKASELEMQALRAQMNPHFIFNSLNSINRFILQNNKLEASDYLTKFSRLVRLILQNSQADLIPVESELEALKLYLELEALRFNQHFDYRISVDENLDTAALKVPPLIIQPFAENAIWHGLMHKEEKGHLDITLSQVEETLYCRVTDDGIGRKKAAELSSRPGSTHRSMGMRITADRIALLQEKKSLHTAVQVNDLVLPDGTAAGTEVKLKLPVLYD